MESDRFGLAFDAVGDNTSIYDSFAYTSNATPCSQFHSSHCVVGNVFDCDGGPRVYECKIMLNLPPYV